MASLFIDGAWVAGSGGVTAPVVNPSDGTVVGEVDVAEAADVDRAVAAARRSFEDGAWARSPAAQRGALLARVADLLIRDQELIAELETRNTGKALRESRIDVDDVASVFRYYAGLADKEPGRIVDTGDPDALSRIVYEPVGVCALIAPWNYPLLQVTWKVAPALAAGNSVVMKPSQVTPLTTIHLTKLLIEAGIPDGVANLVLGPGSSGSARQLAEQPRRRPHLVHRWHGGRDLDPDRAAPRT